MTLDEAITYGEEQLEVFGGEHAEFINMAIRALEMQKKLAAYSRRMSDTISRQAAIDALQGRKRGLNMADIELDLVYDIYKELVKIRILLEEQKNDKSTKKSGI